MSRITKAQLIEENNSLGNQLKDKDLIYVNQFKEISRLKKENGSLIDKMKSTIERKNKTIIGLQKELVRRNQTLKKELETILNNQNTIKNNLIQENKVLNHNCENLHRQNIDFFQLNNKLLQENEKLNSDNIELFNKNINNHLSKVEETNLNGHDIFWYKEQLESVIATRDTYKSELDRMKDIINTNNIDINAIDKMKSTIERKNKTIIGLQKELVRRNENLKNINNNNKNCAGNLYENFHYKKTFTPITTDQKLIFEKEFLKDKIEFQNDLIEQLKNRNFIQRLFNL